MAVQTKYLITHKKSLNIAISGLSAGGMSKFLSDFGFTHLIFVGIYTQGVLFNSASIDFIDMLLISVNIVTLMVFASFMYENRVFVYYAELIRSIAVLLLISIGYFNFMPEIILGYTVLSALISGAIVFKDRFLSPSEAH